MHRVCQRHQHLLYHGDAPLSFPQCAPATCAPREAWVTCDSGRFYRAPFIRTPEQAAVGDSKPLPVALAIGGGVNGAKRLRHIAGPSVSKRDEESYW